MGEAIQKYRILFVDDEPKVLDGIKRMLHHMRNEWDISFATSGNDALEQLAQHPFDVVVSDMRMPEMDGAHLLDMVKKRYPNIIRFILSGYSDKEMILRTVNATDQFLTKPCDPEILKKTITKALESQKLIDKKELQSIVSKMDSIPTLPALYLKLKELLESDKSSFSDIAEVIKKDVAISAKMLQLVNSAFFGLRHRVDDIKRAVTCLGIETIKAIILTTDVFSEFSQKEVHRFSINTLYDHSFRTGLISNQIVLSMSNDKQFAEICLMASMLHDIGKLIFIKNRPEEYHEIFRRQKENGTFLHTLEKEYFSVTHADIGGYLMGVWGLSDDIVNAVSLHHNMLKAIGTMFTGTSAVYIANSLDHENEKNPSDASPRMLDKGYLTKMDLIKYLPEWQKIANIVSEYESNEGGNG